MIGCLLLGAAGLMLMSRIFHRHHYGWHGRCGGGWGGHHRFGGHGGFYGHGHGYMEAPWGGGDPRMEMGPDGGHGYDEGHEGGWGGGGWRRNPFRSGFLARM